MSRVQYRTPKGEILGSMAASPERADLIVALWLEHARETGARISRLPGGSYMLSREGVDLLALVVEP